jgi:hypothetical protein
MRPDWATASGRWLEQTDFHLSPRLESVGNPGMTWTARLVAIIVLAASPAFAGAREPASPPLTVYLACPAGSDLHRVLAANGLGVRRFDTAVYGLPEETIPLLFEQSDRMLIHPAWSDTYDIVAREWPDRVAGQDRQPGSRVATVPWACSRASAVTSAWTGLSRCGGGGGTTATARRPAAWPWPPGR